MIFVICQKCNNIIKLNWFYFQIMISWHAFECENRHYIVKNNYKSFKKSTQLAINNHIYRNTGNKSCCLIISPTCSCIFHEWNGFSDEFCIKKLRAGQFKLNLWNSIKTFFFDIERDHREKNCFSCAWKAISVATLRRWRTAVVVVM